MKVKPHYTQSTRAYRCSHCGRLRFFSVNLSENRICGSCGQRLVMLPKAVTATSPPKRRAKKGAK